MASDYTLNLRYGFKFDRPDSELLQRYLRPKVVSGESEPGTFILPEIDLYGSLPPWDLFDPSSSPISPLYQQLWFCFTPLKKKSPKSSNFDRTVGESGSWNASQKPHQVFLGEQLVGYKRVYNFVVGSKTRTQWLMHELTLPDSYSSSLALCKVINRIPRPKLLHPLPVLPPLPLDAPFPFPLHHLPPASKKQCIRPPPMPPLPDVASTSALPDITASTSTFPQPSTSSTSALPEVAASTSALSEVAASTSTLPPLLTSSSSSTDPDPESPDLDLEPTSFNVDEFAVFLESTLSEDEGNEEQPGT